MELIIVNEVWRSIDGFINYQISNIGNVRNANTGTILKPASNGGGYLSVVLRADNTSRTKMIHRLVATAFIVNTDDKAQVDHIDNDKKNNSANNLRWATPTENQRNKPKTTKSTSSKHIGVYWYKNYNRWRAKITINKKTIHIGYFDDPKDAARAYNERVLGLATEFGVLNEISDNEELI